VTPNSVSEFCAHEYCRRPRKERTNRFCPTPCPVVGEGLGETGGCPLGLADGGEQQLSLRAQAVGWETPGAGVGVGFHRKTAPRPPNQDVTPTPLQPIRLRDGQAGLKDPPPPPPPTHTPNPCLLVVTDRGWGVLCGRGGNKGCGSRELLG